MFSPLIVAKGMRKSNEKIENGPALPAVQRKVLKKNARKKQNLAIHKKFTELLHLQLLQRRKNVVY